LKYTNTGTYLIDQKLIDAKTKHKLKTETYLIDQESIDTKTSKS
jgi:hypothetical protein